MSEQHLLSEGPLLDGNGNLADAGYAYSLVRKYDRKAITASKMRIKEWDYYYVGNAKYGIALTVADNGYMSMASISLLDFRDVPYDITVSKIGAFPMGKLNLPSSSQSGDVRFKGKGFDMAFLVEGKKRHLVCSMSKFGKKKELFSCDVFLEPTLDASMVIATPFKKTGHFYYNQKINNQIAHGYAKLGDTTYDFNQDSFGVLDWGRGVWTYKNTWYWSSVSTKYKGHTIGWNLGYGFGDTSKASENMFFFDDKAYKLNDVTMDISLRANGGDDFMKPWTFRSKEGDIAIQFQPVYDRHADTNLLFLRSNQHQVFGTFSGEIHADGKTFSFEELPGFAEKVYNKW